MEAFMAIVQASATLALVILALVAIYLVHRLMHGICIYFMFRRKRDVTCPRTRQTAVVAFAAKSMAKQAILDEARLHLSDCSIWPERAGCRQDCLREIEARLVDSPR